MTDGVPNGPQRPPRAWVDLTLSLLARGAGAPLAFATNIVVARLLGPAGYGTYLSLLSIALLAGAVGLFGVHRVTTREIATTPEALQRDTLARMLRWSLGFAGATTLATTLAVGVWLSLGFGLVTTGWVERLVVLSLIPLSAGVLLVAALLLGLGSTIGSQALNNAVKNSALLAGVSVLAIAFRPATTLLVLLCQVVAYLVSIGLGVLWTRRVLRRLPARAAAARAEPGGRPVAGAPAAWRRSAGYFFVSSAAVLILSRLDVVLVNALAGPTEAGIFGAANRLIQVAMIGGLVLMGWLQPRFGRALARQRNDRVRTLWSRGTVLALLLTAAPVAAAWLLAPQLMGLMGSGFSASVVPFRWLLLGTMLWGLCFPVGNALLTVAGLEHVLARTTWAQLAVTVALVFLLVPHYGALGGAVAYALGLVIASALLAQASWRAMRTVARTPQRPTESST